MHYSKYGRRTQAPEVLTLSPVPLKPIKTVLIYAPESATQRRERLRAEARRDFDRWHSWMANLSAARLELLDAIIEREAREHRTNTPERTQADLRIAAAAIAKQHPEAYRQYAVRPKAE